MAYSQDDHRINVKLKLMNGVETRKKRSINSIIANFKCGLPNIIKKENNNNKTQFSLYKSRQN